MLDEIHVYLDLEQFEVGYNRVMVSIPVYIWKVIRRYPSPDLSLAEKADDAIRADVTQAVDKRLQEYAAADVALSGLMACGAIEVPRDAQIAAGVAYYTDRRAHQRQVIQIDFLVVFEPEENTS